MAHGMRHAISSLSLLSNINGNVELTAGAACIAGKAIFPIESLSVKPKIASDEVVNAQKENT